MKVHDTKDALFPEASLFLKHVGCKAPLHGVSDLRLTLETVSSFSWSAKETEPWSEDYKFCFLQIELHQLAVY